MRLPNSMNQRNDIQSYPENGVYSNDIYKKSSFQMPNANAKSNFHMPDMTEWMVPDHDFHGPLENYLA